MFILGQMVGERIIRVSSKDYALFQKLQGEVGTLSKPMVAEVDNAGHWYNPDLESSEMAVRGVVRAAVLEKLGYQKEEILGEWIEDTENIGSSLDSNPEVKTTLSGPNFFNYKWQRVSSENLGSFAGLNRGVNNEPIVDAQRGVVLFSDEIQQLADGQAVTTLHSSGFGMGFLVERKEVYKVVNDNLHRIRAQIID